MHKWPGAILCDPDDSAAAVETSVSDACVRGVTHWELQDNDPCRGDSPRARQISLSWLFNRDDAVGYYVKTRSQWGESINASPTQFSDLFGLSFVTFA